MTTTVGRLGATEPVPADPTQRPGARVSATTTGFGNGPLADRSSPLSAPFFAGKGGKSATEITRVESRYKLWESVQGKEEEDISSGTKNGGGESASQGGNETQLIVASTSAISAWSAASAAAASSAMAALISATVLTR